MKKETLQVSLVAVDQVNRTFPKVTIFSSLSHAESGLGKGQMAQITTKNVLTSVLVYTHHITLKRSHYMQMAHVGMPPDHKGIS